MAKGKLPGEFEQLVLLALLRLGRDDAYGMVVRREIADRAEREVSLGAVYSTLDRLERKGQVRTRIGSATRARGGRARRFFEVTSSGRQLLRRALLATDRMRVGLAGFGRPAEAG